MKQSYYVKGMMCAGCTSSVEKSISKLDGVDSVSVNLASETASVIFDESKLSEREIAEAVKSAGYELELNGESETEVTLRINGMHCAGCVGSVEKSLQQVEGVLSASVTLTTEQAVVKYRSSVAGTEELEKAVERAGYSAEAIQNESSGGEPDKLQKKRAREEEKLRDARKKMVLSWIITLPLMIWMFVDMVLGFKITSHAVMESVMTAGAGFVILYPGLQTLRGAWRSALNINPNMDVLIAIGTIASLVTGIMALSYHIGISSVMIYSFSGIAAMIMAFHLTGRYVETKAKGRASDAITKLLTLEAERARVIRNGAEMEIDSSDLRKGDTMLIRPGEKRPADGKVVDGTCSVDEAMVTGESMPVVKQKGDEVIGGTINIEGAMHVKATRVGSDSFLNQVVNLVEEAQNSKIPIQDFADRVTAVFVPVILGIASSTFLMWWILPELFQPVLEFGDRFLPWILSDLPVVSQAFYAALAVLVIACPCALGLATPTALMVGSGLGAENGILIRKGEAIQRMEEVTTFVFDKTGTLTNGRPEVTDMILIGDSKRREAAYAASLENLSEHPIGKAIVRYFESDEVSHEAGEFKSHIGMGVEGQVDGHHVAAGNEELMEKLDVKIPEGADSDAKELMEESKSVIYVSVDNMLISLFALQDTLKKDAGATIRQIHAQGFKTMMITGDQAEVAKSIADEIGLADFRAKVKPDEKAAIIKKLQEEGEVVAMVGDGINDAPALAQSDVGIALGSGTDVAIESGSIILIKGDLEAVLKAIDLSRLTMKKIRQNLFWAFFYNVMMIPAAVVGWMHPVLAEIAMALSSINVVGNSKRLEKRKPSGLQ